MEISTRDFVFIERCLFNIARNPARHDGICIGETKRKKKYLESTIAALNRAVAVEAADSGAEYRGSSHQLAILFSSYGGKLYSCGWRREMVKVIRGNRTYRFILP